MDTLFSSLHTISAGSCEFLLFYHLLSFIFLTHSDPHAAILVLYSEYLSVSLRFLMGVSDMTGSCAIPLLVFLRFC